jgi:pimeloyl-ACP methyl ester carboxylesterase
MFFSSIRDKREFENGYINIIEQITSKYEFYEIETSFGNVNIIDVNRNKDLPTLIVVHGLRGAGPLFLRNLMPLKDQCRIIIVDSIEKLELNHSNVLTGEYFDHGQWVFEIMARLDLENVILMGISVGAVSVLNTLSFEDRKISATILCSPIGITTKPGSLRFRWKLRNYAGMNSTLVWNDQLKSLAHELISEPSPFTFDYIKQFISRFSFKFPEIKAIDPAVSSRIKTPVYLLTGEKDRLFSAKHMVSEAKSLIPNLRKAVVLKGEKHFMGLEEMSSELKHIIAELTANQEA